MFASDLDPASRAQLARGARLVELLKQPQASPLPVEEEVVVDLDRHHRPARRHRRGGRPPLRERVPGLRAPRALRPARGHPRVQEARGRDPLGPRGRRRRRSRRSSAPAARRTCRSATRSPTPSRTRTSSRSRSSSSGADPAAGCARATVTHPAPARAGEHSPYRHPHREPQDLRHTREAESYGSADAGLPPAHPVRPGDQEDHERHGADRGVAGRQGPPAGRGVHAVRPRPHPRRLGRGDVLQRRPPADGRAPRGAPRRHGDHHQRPRPGRRLLLERAQGEREARREAARPRARRSFPTSSVARRVGFYKFRRRESAATWDGFSDSPSFEEAREIGDADHGRLHHGVRRGRRGRGPRRLHPVRLDGDPGARGHPAAAAGGRRGRGAAGAGRGAAAVRVRAGRRAGARRAAAQVRHVAACSTRCCRRRPRSWRPASAR